MVHMAGRNTKKRESLLVVNIIPETQIIAPLMPKEQIKRYIQKGWMDEDAINLNRAFWRNSQGKPIIFKKWLDSPIRKLYREKPDLFKIPKNELLSYVIVDDEGFPVNYIVLDEQPLRYRRPIIGKGIAEYYEYIDSTYTLKAKILTKYPKDLAVALNMAGRIGMNKGTSQGYGKFRVVIE